MATIVARKNKQVQNTSSHHPQIMTSPVDIYENNDAILIQADMPGVKKEDLSVTVENGTISLCGSRQFKSCGTTRFEEFAPVKYQRGFTLPKSIDTTKITAKLRDGVLVLNMPKSEAVKSRVVEISCE